MTRKPRQPSTEAPSARAHGFPNARHFILPVEVQGDASHHPLLTDLLPLAAGHFPHATGHLITRSRGLQESILIWCSEGEGWCRFSGREWALRAHEGVIIPAGRPHAYGSSPRHPWSIYWVHARGRRLQDHIDLLGATAANPVWATEEPGETTLAFEDLLRRFRLGFTLPALAARSAALASLLAELAVCRAEAHPVARAARDRVRNSTEFMVARFSRNLRVADMAHAAGLSVPHYAALFRREFGCGPLAYFVQLKMQEACRALSHSDEPVQAIAERLGFSDPFYFSRTFRRVQGTSPTAFRALHRG